MKRNHRPVPLLIRFRKVKRPRDITAPLLIGFWGLILFWLLIAFLAR